MSMVVYFPFTSLARKVPRQSQDKHGRNAAWSDGAKAMSRKLGPTDSLYRLGFSPGLAGKGFIKCQAHCRSSPRRARGGQLNSRHGSSSTNRESRHSSACFKSSIKSSLSSNPRETLTVPGLTPARCNSSSVMS